MRVCAVKGTKCAFSAGRSRSRRLNFCLASTTMLRPSGVSSASEASCAASASRCSVTPGAGRKADAWRLPSVMVPVLSSSSTSTSPAASTARPEVAITLACIMRLMPATPMADSSPPMVVGIRHTSSAISTVMRDRRAGLGGLDAEDRERQQRDRDHQEDDRQRHQQDGQRDLVGRLLALGAFDHRDHAVEEGLARVDGDAHDEPVGQHARAAGDGREVAARFADHRRRFAGDGALVDRGHAFDHLAVERDHVAGLDQHDVALAQLVGVAADATCAPWLRLVQLLGRTVCFFRPRSDAACALLRPSASASAKLANSTVNHSHSAMARMKPAGASPCAAQRLHEQQRW